MSMHAQPGIFAFGTIEHCYVEFDLTPGRDPVELGAALAGLHGPDTPLVATSAVVGLRPELWASIAPDATPPGVRSFAPIEAGDYSMPATQQDAWIWLAGASRDSVFDSTLAAIRLLDGLASVATDVSGFGYRRNRDLTGFIDGTENPPAARSTSGRRGGGRPRGGRRCAACPAVGALEQFRHTLDRARVARPAPTHTSTRVWTSTRAFARVQLPSPVRTPRPMSEKPASRLRSPYSCAERCPLKSCACKHIFQQAKEWS
jgi:deferrochelatase/peroxidase EfeB